MTNIESSRRKDIVTYAPKTKTRFASIQYQKRSSHLYNKLYGEIKIYPLLYRECKKRLTEWLRPLTYEETESMLQYIR